MGDTNSGIGAIERAEVLVATCSSYDSDEDPEILAAAVADLCAMVGELVELLRSRGV